LLVAAAIAGCGVDGSGMLGAVESDDPNATDAAFARAMVAHQRRTGEIARIGARDALRDELRRAARGALSQTDRALPRLVHGADRLRDRGVSPVGGGIVEPPPVDMRRLRSPVSLDHEFLERMIRQHEYAMTAAAAERARGGDRRLKAVAGMIYESSRRDLAMLKRWLRTWYGEYTPHGVPPVPPGGGGGGGGGGGPGPPV
jgi:uncharacterized protein (DUF305 family)